MFKFVLLLVCLAVTEGRNIQRFIRDESSNSTASDIDLKNATANAEDAPEVSELQADLVAPASGPKPLEAKYTIRVKPKLKDGVPQIQEIRIMPPKSNSTNGFVKPLMVLKQNVTKPLIENIEIDIPEKGVKFASKPSVEVIEGQRKEMMKVTKGQVVVENAAQKSETNSEDKQAKPQDQAVSQNTTASSSSQNTTEPSTSKNATDSASSQKPPEKSASQDAPEKNITSSTQTQAANQTQSPATSQTQTAAAPQTQAHAAPETQTATATAPETQTQAAPQNTVSNYYQPTYQTQPSAPAAPIAPVYSPPAPAAYSSAVPQTCTNDVRCQVYPDDRCREQWLMTNCRLKCRLCSK
ncbi:mucin-7-like isoform X1 [Orbicella faveolata]|uniref:mucin-7-like isoform X1 n=1 Tax=Orbicella faveolata TaxID=48498 RepID=UPI0009E538C2|nr:mucin-7-like isoform X1 [Orbicella faveolata]